MKANTKAVVANEWLFELRGAEHPAYDTAGPGLGSP